MKKTKIAVVLSKYTHGRSYSKNDKKSKTEVETENTELPLKGNSLNPLGLPPHVRKVKEHIPPTVLTKENKL